MKSSSSNLTAIKILKAISPQLLLPKSKSRGFIMRLTEGLKNESNYAEKSILKRWLSALSCLISTRSQVRFL